MFMIYYAVIDTNVFVSALLSKNNNSSTVKVLDGRIIPLYHKDILAEYSEVLRREKFHLKEETVQIVIYAVQQYGIEVFPKSTGEILIDEDDRIFYETAIEMRANNAYLVTGNQKHYPVKDFIVTPAVMVDIIDKKLL